MRCPRSGGRVFPHSSAPQTFHGDGGGAADGRPGRCAATRAAHVTRAGRGLWMRGATVSGVSGSGRESAAGAVEAGEGLDDQRGALWGDVGKPQRRSA